LRPAFQFLYAIEILHFSLNGTEAEGLVPGREMELICARLESEMLHELGLTKRPLNWGHV
jgi:hypothetical protein